jgi:hypothetical protein
VSLALSLSTSFFTLLGMWLVGDRRASGWVIAIANQVLWVALIIDTQAWGLFLLVAALLVIYGRNLWLWTRHCPKECSEMHTYGRWCKAR